MRGSVPETDEDYEGPATIESYTVFYNRDASVRFGTIIARTANGARVLARVPAEDAQMIAFLTNGAAEPVGAQGPDFAGCRWFDSLGAGVKRSTINHSGSINAGALLGETASSH